MGDRLLYLWSQQNSNAIRELFGPGDQEDSSKCTDWSKDCCASGSRDEAQTCVDGWIPVETGSLCKFTTNPYCKSRACYGCFPAHSMTAQMELKRLKQYGAMDNSRCTDIGSDCCASDSLNEKQTCSGNYWAVPDPDCKN